MSLKWKVVLLLSVVFAMLATMAYAVQRLIVYPSFVVLEDAGARDDMGRCVDAVRREVEHLAAVCRDWSALAAVSDFVETRDPQYSARNLTTLAFANNRLDAVCYLDPAGRVVWGGVSNGSSPPRVEPATDLFDALRADPALTTHPTPASAVDGVVLTPRGPMLVAARPIVAGNHAGPPRGTLIVGRFLGDAAVADLGQRTRVSLAAWPAVAGQLPPAERGKLDDLIDAGKGGGVLIEEGAGDTLRVYTLLRDLRGAPAVVLRATVPAAISANGRVAIHYAVATTVASGAVVLLMLWMQLTRWVVRPLTRVTRHAVVVGQRDDLSARLGMNRSDEVGLLANELDRMVARLQESRANMLDTAHRAGMAEIASEVLHNVGNALNTVHVSTEVLGETLNASKVDGLGKAAALLGEHGHDLPAFLTSDARGKKVIGYLAKLSDTLSAEQGQMRRELVTLREKVDHIREIISLQQTYASGAPFVQEADAAALIEDVLKMHAGLLARHHIRVDRDLAGAAGPARLQKTKLMQVLVNLVKNAIESMAARGGPDLRLAVAARRVASDDCGEGGAAGASGAGDALEITITDTGCGIDAAAKPRMFSSGFTTKTGGHGIGLHYCANAVASMDGTISAASNGAGRGATFTIRLRNAGARAGPDGADGTKRKAETESETPAGKPAAAADRFAGVAAEAGADEARNEAHQ